MSAKADPLTKDERARWRQWEAYLKCRKSGHDGVPLDRDPNTEYRCEKCGTTYHYVTTVVESSHPRPALCPKEHWRGVACDTKGCSW